MNLTINIDNNLECALFKFKGQAPDSVVPPKDIIFSGKAKKLQKAIKKLPNGKYNIAVISADNKFQFGMLLTRKNKVNTLSFS